MKEQATARSFSVARMVGAFGAELDVRSFPVSSFRPAEMKNSEEPIKIHQNDLKLFSDQND